MTPIETTIGALVRATVGSSVGTDDPLFCLPLAFPEAVVPAYQEIVGDGNHLICVLMGTTKNTWS